MRDYANCICCMQLLIIAWPSFLSWWVVHSAEECLSPLIVSAVFQPPRFSSPGHSALLFHKKNTPVKKTFTCILGFVFQCYNTFFQASEFVPHHFFFSFPDSFIFLWYWEFVDEGLLICCVFSPPPSPHYSSPFTPFKSFRY